MTATELRTPCNSPLAPPLSPSPGGSGVTERLEEPCPLTAPRLENFLQTLGFSPLDEPSPPLFGKGAPTQDRCPGVRQPRWGPGPGGTQRWFCTRHTEKQNWGSGRMRDVRRVTQFVVDRGWDYSTGGLNQGPTPARARLINRVVGPHPWEHIPGVPLASLRAVTPPHRGWERA